MADGEDGAFLDDPRNRNIQCEHLTHMRVNADALCRPRHGIRPRRTSGIVARRAGTRSIRSFFAQAMVGYTMYCLPVDADNGGVCSLSCKLPCDGRNIFLLPSLRFGEGRRLGHIAGKLVNVRHHVRKNRLERKDLNDEEPSKSAWTPHESN